MHWWSNKGTVRLLKSNSFCNHRHCRNSPVAPSLLMSIYDEVIFVYFIFIIANSHPRCISFAIRVGFKHQLDALFGIGNCTGRQNEELLSIFSVEKVCFALILVLSLPPYNRCSHVDKYIIFLHTFR